MSALTSLEIQFGQTRKYIRLRNTSDWEIHQTGKYIRLGNTSDWEIYQTGKYSFDNLGKKSLCGTVYLCTYVTGVLQPNICIILWSFPACLSLTKPKC